ncbi:hypothetical protein [Microbacterium sp. AR7-10]|nr:hypothetical protein [Microbacterium sp. AR7-10]
MPADSEFAIDCHDLVIDRIGHGGTTRAVDGAVSYTHLTLPTNSRV